MTTTKFPHWRKLDAMPTLTPELANCMRKSMYSAKHDVVIAEGTKSTIDILANSVLPMMLMDTRKITDMSFDDPAHPPQFPWCMPDGTRVTDSFAGAYSGRLMRKIEAALGWSRFDVDFQDPTVEPPCMVPKVSKSREKRERKMRRALFNRRMWNAKVLLVRHPVTGEVQEKPFSTLPADFINFMIENGWPTPTCTMTTCERTGSPPFTFISYEVCTGRTPVYDEDEVIDEPSVQTPNISDGMSRPTTASAEASRPASPSVAAKRWQMAIRRVIKENKHHKEQTLKNMEESEHRRRIRAACNETKERKAKEWENKAMPGIAPAVGRWAEDQPTVSDLAAAAGKKAVALNNRKEAIRKQREAAHAKMAAEAAAQAERDRLREVGFAMMHNEKESIVQLR
jgi:hypothetical protein